jgi:hypothetical protein
MQISITLNLLNKNVCYITIIIIISFNVSLLIKWSFYSFCLPFKDYGDLKAHLTSPLAGERNPSLELRIYENHLCCLNPNPVQCWGWGKICQIRVQLSHVPQFLGFLFCHFNHLIGFSLAWFYSPRCERSWVTSTLNPKTFLFFLVMT